MKTAVLTIMPAGAALARRVAGVLHADRFACREIDGFQPVESLQLLMQREFNRYDAWIFVGATGICVRTVAPWLADKHTDPAVVCVDSAGRWVIPVVSGHVGGANGLAERIAAATGATAVVTTQSDGAGLWALDTLDRRFGWTVRTAGISMNGAIARYVDGARVALLIEIRGAGALWMEQTAAGSVTVCYDRAAVPDDAELVIALSYSDLKIDKPLLQYIPRALSLGVGCRRGCSPDGVADQIRRAMREAGLAVEAVAAVATVEQKADEPLVGTLCRAFGAEKRIFTAAELSAVEVPNPSERVAEAVGTPSVSEAAAILAAKGGTLVVGKQKGRLAEGSDFTFALAVDPSAGRCAHVEIVGAGPGDPDLISVRGRRFLEEADLILYAGSLVPKEVTSCAKATCVVRSSASLNLEEQFALMKEYYDRGLLVVRLHTGDPCIYGAIEEQMNFFDRFGMRYHITPGISSFQAAAAELKSQFTIPERVQTIILTRGEGRTPMPERERLHRLAASQSTMCIFLSAGIARRVQEQLLVHYPPQTPVAVCHRLTWPDQRIWRGELRQLADIVESNHLTLTTMIVVGEAIDNRQGLSRLYAADFKHLFRP